MKTVSGFLIAVAALALSAGMLKAGENREPVVCAGQVLYEIKAGILAHDVDHLWSGSRKEDGIDFNAEVIFAKPRFFLRKGVIRPNLGASLNNRGDTSKIYAGAIYEINADIWFLNLGLGAAWHDGETDRDDRQQKSLGARVLFRIPIEFGLTLNAHHRVSILFDHVSNADLADPNEGLDTLGLRYGFRF